MVTYLVRWSGRKHGRRMDGGWLGKAPNTVSAIQRMQEHVASTGIDEVKYKSVAER